jgi:hypothetical protein
MGRRVTDLKAPVRAKLKRLKELARERGLDFIVTSTLRTQAEQFAYFAQGRQPLEEVNRLRKEAGLAPINEKENSRTVTRTLDSAHLKGLAFDVAIIGKDPFKVKAEEASGQSAPPFRKGGNPKNNEQSGARNQSLIWSEIAVGAGLAPPSIKKKEMVWSPKADINKNQIPDYEELGKLAESIGLTWGGRFKFRDYGHFELKDKNFKS